MRLLMAVAHLNFHLMRATQLADWLWSHLGRVIKSRAHCRSAVIVSSAARVTHFRVAEYYDRPARPLVHLLIEGGHRLVPQTGNVRWSSAKSRGICVSKAADYPAVVGAWHGSGRKGSR